MNKRLRFISILGIILLLTLSTTIAWADGETGTFTGLAPHAQVSGTLDGEPQTHWGGTMRFQIAEGDLTYTFCTDLLHHVSSGDTFVASDEVMACHVRWLLLHYPPRPSGYTPWPEDGALSDIGEEMAARQAAVWHFSDGFTPDTGNTIGDRAWEIINSVPDDPCADDQPAVTITPASVVNPINTTQTFTVTVTRGGEPASGQVVNLTADIGTLSADTVTTGDQGEATFTLTHDAPDVTSNIDASAEMTLPVGTIFVGTEPNKQKLVLGEETLGLVHGSATATWTGSGSVTTLSFADYDMDEEHDSGEPLLEGWTVTLYKDNAGSWDLIDSETTDSAGTAHFTGLSAGDYRVVETLASNWYNTTPLDVEFTLATDESHSFIFGQIKLPVIVGHVFQDDDADGTYDAGEPPLEGWDLQLYRDDGSIVVGMQGATGEDGEVIFSSHPERDPPDIVPGGYIVQETLQEEWYATTGISQTVTVDPGDIGHAWLGNIHPEPALALEKIGPLMAHEGDEIAYEFTVTNEGNVPLTGAVSDPLLPDLDCDFSGLAPGESYICGESYVVPGDEGATDPLENTATATATEPYLGGEASDSASSSTDVLHPDLELTLTPSPDETYAGEPVELAYEATNVGDTTLYDVSITSDNGTPGDPSDDYEVCAAGELGIAESLTCDEMVTLDEDTTYTATAAGRDVLDGPAEDQAQTTVTFLGERDTDGDGIPDDEEGDDDADGDGVPNYQDTDADGDTIPDEIEGADDADGDGTPNFLDRDSDGDTIPDEIEGADDADGDGTPNFLDLDSDGDTIPDEIEGAGDADGGGTPNFLDLDSDGDGLLDSQEWSTGPDDPLAGGTADDPVCYDNDADGDGTPNFLDPDSDGDGIPDGEEGTRDSDGDGIPDWLDPDPGSESNPPRLYYLPLVFNGGS